MKKGTLEWNQLFMRFILRYFITAVTLSSICIKYIFKLFIASYTKMLLIFIYSSYIQRPYWTILLVLIFYCRYWDFFTHTIISSVNNVKLRFLLFNTYSFYFFIFILLDCHLCNRKWKWLKLKSSNLFLSLMKSFQHWTVF